MVAKTTQLTDDEVRFVEVMRSASDQYSPFTRDEISRLIAIIDRLDRAYDALRRGYYPGDPATESAATPLHLTSLGTWTDDRIECPECHQRDTSVVSIKGDHEGWECDNCGHKWYKRR